MRMNNTADVIRIFIPSCALDIDTCVLLGWKISDTVCCITGHVDIANLDNTILKRDFISRASDGHGDKVTVLGFWENTTQSSCHDKKVPAQVQELLARGCRLFHFVKTNAELPHCTLLDSRRRDKLTDVNIIILTFDVDDVHSSTLLELERPETKLGQLYQGWKKSLEYFDKQGITSKSVVQTFVPIYKSWTKKCKDWLQQGIIQICLILSTVILFICDNGLFGPLSCRFIPQPATLLHLQKLAREIQSMVKSQHPASMLKEFRLSSLLCRRLVDILLGLTMMHFLMTEDNTKLIADTVMTWTQSVAGELQQLLNWMMGVPAGLKLNYELAHFLGQFFLYHIYLWTGYLEFLAPQWPSVVHYVAISGCLGITTQISLIQDMLSIMTLHSYCFYVYAARLYNLQMSGLLSLWRLFRGKKYNPLFERIDSSSYDADQLFVGTLLFTILLFLLPTTGLFYVVFTGLRVMVLIVHGVMYKMVGVLDSLPIYVMYIRITEPCRVTGDVRLHVLPSSPCGPLYHAIQLLPVSMTRLLEVVHNRQALSASIKNFGETECPTSSSTSDRAGIPNTDPVDKPSVPPSEKTAYSWGRLVHMLMYGHLIYPWIDPVKRH